MVYCPYMAINAKATQGFVPIKEVRDGIIVLKDGGLRAVVIASSINLSLKSADEQHAILLQFQNFLNSIEFSTQIIIQSRRLNIQPYLVTLENRMKEQLEPLLKVQTKEYIEFIKSFTEQVNIMTKNFFIVIPYSATTIGNTGGITQMFTGFNKSSKEAKEDALAAFEEKRSQLEERITVIQQGLNRCGIRSTQLGTEEIIELFYKIFNPGETEQNIKLE